MYKGKSGEECRCKCPTCGEIFLDRSKSLDPTRLNYKYCVKHEKNRNKHNEGEPRFRDNKETRHIVRTFRDRLS